MMMMMMSLLLVGGDDDDDDHDVVRTCLSYYNVTRNGTPFIYNTTYVCCARAGLLVVVAAASALPAAQAQVNTRHDDVTRMHLCR